MRDSEGEGARARPAFIDVDGTLLDCSSERLFLAHLVGTGRLGAASVAGFLTAYAAHPIRTVSQGPGWNRTYLGGMDARAAEADAEEFSRTALVPRIRPVVDSLLRQLGGRGFTPILLSASLSWLIRPLGAAVGASDAVGSVPGERDGVLTGRIEGERPWGAAKRAMAGRLAEAAGFMLPECCALGNSSSDVPLLSSCGIAYAVHPSRSLARIARERGWQTMGGRS